jgi:hypothetical protein
METSLSSKTHQIRRYIACVLLGFVVANFITTTWLTYKYIGTRPTHPDPSLGWIYPFKNHGAYYYLSETELSSVTLTFWTEWYSTLLIIIIIPKQFRVSPADTRRWVTHLSASFRTGLEEFKFGYFATMLAGLLSTIGVFILFGSELAQFAIGHGFVVH